MEHARKTTYARRARRFPHGLATMNHMEALHENLWPAPYAGKLLNATVVVPGSKSLSNRYLILAALGSDIDPCDWSVYCVHVTPS